MKHFIVVLLVFIQFSASGLQATTLSPEAQISLLTASPGTELYSVFGHSGLRVTDPLTGIDEVYNYGTFDFNTPNFYLKFTRGKLLYQLTVSTTRQFLWEYEYEQRAMYEQVLNLTSEEKQRIYNFLQINRLPENKEYLYDFFYDNCATRIRDLIDDLLFIDWGDDPYPGGVRSFRQMLHPYLSNTHWARFGIDLVLGLPADKLATPWHYMFLPDEMFVAFAQARHADGRTLTEGYSILLQEAAVNESVAFITPGRLMWLVLLLAVLSLLSRKFSSWFDRVFFGTLGLTGLVILILWFLSDHESTNHNMNLLWALPTHLYFAFRIHDRIEQTPKLVRYYFIGVAIISMLLITLWPLIPQGFHGAFLPIMATSGLKALNIYIRHKP